MGVRESVEQGGPEEIRLHYIVEQKERPEQARFEFDPETDMIEQNWGRCLSFMLAEYAVTYKRHSGHERPEPRGWFHASLEKLSILSEKRSQEFRKKLENFQASHKESVEKIDWQEVKKDWHKECQSLFLRSVTFYSGDPDNLQEKIKQNTAAEVEAEVHEMLDTYKKWHKDPEFAFTAATARLYGMDRGTLLDDETWQSLGKYVNSTNDQSTILDCAFAMKILAASEVRVTKHGLEFGDKQGSSFKEETLPRPERRQF